MIMTDRDKQLMVQSCKEALLYVIEADETPAHKLVLYENNINRMSDEHVLTLVFGGHKDLIMENNPTEAILNEIDFSPISSFERFMYKLFNPLPEYNFSQYVTKIKEYEKHIDYLKDKKPYGYGKTIGRIRNEIGRYESGIKANNNWDLYQDKYGFVTKTKETIGDVYRGAENALKDNFANNSKSIKEFLSKIKNHPATKWIAITALVAIMIYISYKIYDRHFSKAAEACKSFSGDKKTVCMQAKKMEAYNLQMNELLDAKKGCDNTTEPHKCSKPIVNKIKSIELKMSKLKNKSKRKK